MEELSTIQAQKIAEGIMEIIPYNINIMDKKGYIIASGDKTRIMTLHMGAVHTLSTSEPYIIYDDTPTERKGVNLPIMYENQIVGVIGISGIPKDVMPIAQIIQFTVKLMMENQEYNKVSIMRETQERDFFLEWANYSKIDYSQAFIERGRALEIQIMRPYVAVLLMSAKNDEYGISEAQMRRNIKLDKGEYIIWYRRHDVLLALLECDDLAQRVEDILESTKNMFAASIGEIGTSLYYSIKQARRLKSIGPKLYPGQKVMQYAAASMDIDLLSADASKDILSLQEKIKEADFNSELEETIYVYTNNTEDILKICKILHIHRNTLNYRLNRIQEISMKNPRNACDLQKLYIAILRNRAQLNS